MTTTDWIIDIVLVLIVVRQMREERLSVRFVLLPAGIVYYVLHSFVHSVPTAGNDLVLIIGLAALGTTLGVVGGMLTKMRAENGSAFVRAGFGAASLWVVSMTARLVFIIWITSSAGGEVIGRFSASHSITGADVWQTALVFLALSEVIARISVIVLRGHLMATASRPSTARKLVNA